MATHNELLTIARSGELNAKHRELLELQALAQRRLKSSRANFADGMKAAKEVKRDLDWTQKRVSYVFQSRGLIRAPTLLILHILVFGGTDIEAEPLKPKPSANTPPNIEPPTTGTQVPRTKKNECIYSQPTVCFSSAHFSVSLKFGLAFAT